jgi:NAD(P)-dependent dehydrogenase (short-subunit alcohol dehydrogenase family)
MERGLITGASRGIGRAIAMALARHDLELLIQGRDAGALDETANLVRDRGGNALAFTADLGRAEDVDRLAAATGTGPFHLLVNNAGGAAVERLEELSLAAWQEALAVGVTAPFLLTQRLLPRMPRGASIVNVLSVAARRGFPGWSAYCACKAALDGFSKSVREEARARGVRVIGIFPAATATALWEGVPGDWPRERMLAVEEVAAAVRYALSRPPDTLVEEIHLGHIGGTL